MKLRNRLVINTLKYCKNIVPLIKESLIEGRDLFELFMYMDDPEEFLENIELIIDSTKEIVINLKYIDQRHQDVIIKANSMQNEAKRLEIFFESLIEKNENTLQQLEKKSHSLFEKRNEYDTNASQADECIVRYENSPFGLILIFPKFIQSVINRIKSYFKTKQAKNALHDVNIKKEQNKIDEEAYNSIKNELIPSLKSYLDVIIEFRLLFSAFHNECLSVMKCEIKFRTKKAKCLFKQIKAKSKKLSNGFSRVSSFFDLVECKILAMSELLHCENYATIWDDKFAWDL
jgi:hypothetical protein